MNRLLVVDDEPEIGEVIRALLEDANTKVLCARDGVEALELTRSALPALVLTDVMMPRLDGLELCAVIKSDPATRHIPVILMSAGRKPRENPSADLFVPKPFDAATLEEAIGRLLPSA